MAFYSFGSTIEANRLQNELDAQADGYASYADMLAAQGSSPWARIANGEQVDVFSTLTAVGAAMASPPPADPVEDPVATPDPAFDPIVEENLHCAENGGTLLGDVATGMCVYQDTLWSYPEADPGLLTSERRSSISPLLIIGGLAAVAFLVFRRSA